MTGASPGIVLLQFGTFLALTDDLDRAFFSGSGMPVTFGLRLGLVGVRLTLEEERPEYGPGIGHGRE